LVRDRGWAMVEEELEKDCGPMRGADQDRDEGVGR